MPSKILIHYFLIFWKILITKTSLFHKTSLSSATFLAFPFCYLGSLDLSVGGLQYFESLMFLWLLGEHAVKVFEEVNSWPNESTIVGSNISYDTVAVTATIIGK